jgi:hypothetical protein
VRHKMACLAGLAVLALGALAAFSFAGDRVEPRSRLLAISVKGIHNSMEVADFDVVAEQAQKKFGPRTEVTFESKTGMIVAMVDGKVMSKSELKMRIINVHGMFLVGPQRNDMARFPFSMAVADEGATDYDVDRIVRMNFSKRFPQFFDFDRKDWAKLRCWSQDAPDAGPKFASKPPRLNKASLCLVRWLRGEAKTMLIGALAADGGDWVRGASGPICGALAANWVQMTTAGYGGVDFVACVLVHDPDRGSRDPGDTVAERLYEVGPNRSLLSIH